jgi:hypothetical protein
MLSLWAAGSRNSRRTFDPIQGGKLELFVQAFFLFFLYGSDNAKKSVGLVADPGREIKPIIKKVESPKSVEI